MSGVTTATVIAGVTAAAAVAGTAYTIMSSGSRQQSSPQQVQQALPSPAAALPPVPEPVKAPEPEAVPEKETVKPKLAAEIPDPSRGAAGTMLTGGLGVTGETTTKKKTLLGA